MFFSLIHIFIVAIFTDFYTFDFFPFLGFRSVFSLRFFLLLPSCFSTLLIFRSLFNFFLVPIYYRMEIPLLARFIFLLYAFFTAFRLFVLFLFVTFLFLNFSAWIFLHGFGFWIRTFFT